VSVAATALVVALSLAWVAFAAWGSGALWSFPRFLLALWVLVYLPGRALLDRLRLRLRCPEGVTLALLLGMITVSGAYWLAGLLGVRPLLWAVPAVAAGVYFPPRLARWRELAGAALPAEPWLPALVAVAVSCCALFFAVPSLYRNFAWLPAGEMTYYPLPDVVLHLSLARGLERSVPPELPFLPGEVRPYHYGLDLLLAVFQQAGLDPLDVAVRFVPTFGMVLLVLSSFCFHREWLGAEGPALLASTLVVLGEDLSWIPGLVKGGANWGTSFFGVPTLPSIYGLNPMLLALPLLFASLLGLTRFFREGGRAWCWIGCGLTAALFQYKIFAGLQLLLALGAAALVWLALRRDRRPLAAALLAAALVLPLALPIGLAAGRQAAFQRTSTPYVAAAFERTGLGESWLGRRAKDFWASPSPAPASVAAYLGLALPLYLVGSLGLRIVGLPGLGRSLLSPRTVADPARFLIAVFTVVGPLLTLSLSVHFTSYQRIESYDNAVWFFVQSKAVAWVWAVESAAALTGAPRRLALAALFALSVPSSAEFLAYQAQSPLSRLGPDEQGLLRHFERGVQRGSVVLARPPVAEALIAMTPCRAPVFTVFAQSWMPKPELVARLSGLEDFWAGWRAGELRPALLRQYGVAYVVVDKAVDGVTTPPGLGLLGREYENARYAVHPVAGPR
jgi:hypothetical protein